MKLFLLMFILLGLSSCEQSVTGFTLPFKEEIIIDAVLTAGKPFEKIYISKTVDPLTSPTLDNVKITDAKVTITSLNNVSELKYKEEIEYASMKDTVMEDTEYKIEVEWKGLKASAITKVPKRIPIDSIEIIKTPSTSGYFKWTEVAYFNIFDNSVCTLGRGYYDEQSDTYYFSHHFNESLYKKINNKTNMRIEFQKYFGDDGPYESIQTLVLDAYSPEFEKYYTSRYNGDGGDGIFGESNNIKGNVTGDGFGLFVSRTRTFRNYKLN